MTNLRTLREMDEEYPVCINEFIYALRQEAIKRIKNCKCRKIRYDFLCNACERDIWFNNLTEKDLEAQNHG